MEHIPQNTGMAWMLSRGNSLVLLLHDLIVVCVYRVVHYNCLRNHHPWTIYSVTILGALGVDVLGHKIFVAFIYTLHILYSRKIWQGIKFGGLANSSKQASR